MSFSSATVSIGATTKKLDYDRLMENTKELMELMAGTVKLTGAQTIAGVKTFTSAPLLPADTVEEEDIQAGAVTDEKIGKSFTAGGTVSIGANEAWTPAAGFYVWVSLSGVAELVIYQGGEWRRFANVALMTNSGFFITDGVNVRLQSGASSPAGTVYYLKLA